MIPSKFFSVSKIGSILFFDNALAVGLFGLIITTERLQAIRALRQPNSRYASKEQCEYELKQLEKTFQKEHIQFLNITAYSIEEIATKIMKKMGLKRNI